jgi:hypothetical protein
MPAWPASARDRTGNAEPIEAVMASAQPKPDFEQGSPLSYAPEEDEDAAASGAATGAPPMRISANALMAPAATTMQPVISAAFSP